MDYSAEQSLDSILPRWAEFAARGVVINLIDKLTPLLQACQEQGNEILAKEILERQGPNNLEHGLHGAVVGLFSFIPLEKDRSRTAINLLFTEARKCLGQLGMEADYPVVELLDAIDDYGETWIDLWGLEDQASGADTSNLP